MESLNNLSVYFLRLRPATSHFPQEGPDFKEDSRTLWMGQSTEKSHIDLAFAVIDSFKELY